MSPCIKTPYALNRPGGYGKFTLEGKQVNHSRAVYVQHHGLKLADLAGKLVRHTCHSPSCINPEHLILGTFQDNMDDKVAAGNWKGGQPKKLTATQVAEIRAATREEPKDLAVKYGVSRKTITNALNGKSCYPFPQPATQTMP